MFCCAGVGPSGLGSYHGKWGFDAFSHAKSVLTAPTWADPKLRYITAFSYS